MAERILMDDEPTIDSEPQPNWVPALTVLSGKARGARVEVAGEHFTVGRAEDNGLVLKDKAVSRKHATIEKKDGRFLIRDLGSTWGVKVAGEKVEEAALSYGSEIEIAGVRMAFGQLLRDELSPAGARSPVRIAILILAALTLAALGAIAFFHFQSQKMLDRPGGDIVSQVIYHYDKGILYYEKIHLDPDNRGNHPSRSKSSENEAMMPRCTAFPDPSIERHILTTRHGANRLKMKR